MRKVARCRAVVDKLLEGRAVVYGLTTGFGSLRDILIPPGVLGAKEGLALDNGTQFMAAIGVLALPDAVKLAHASARICALRLEAIKGVPRSLDPRLHAVRPHPGQSAVARMIRAQI